MAERIQGFQRAALMKQAHSLQPVVHVGKMGITTELQDHLERELEQHELVKVRFTDHKDERRSLSHALAEGASAILVAVIGNTCVMYRAASDPDLRRIHMPNRSNE